MDRTGNARPVQPRADPPEYRPGNSRAGTGRLAAEIDKRPLQWFLDPLFPYGVLSLVVGNANSGKSTLGAWLCANARRPAILPGMEESVDTALVPRLEVSGVNLWNTLILDDRPWVFPNDRAHLTAVLKDFQCDFLLIDPIDSYLGEAGENEGQAVRAMLESVARLAREVGCAVVGTRHPGKAEGNICPGSRQWRNVPRVIVQLDYYKGPPELRLLCPYKDGFGTGWQARLFELVGEARQPKRFVLGETADPRAAELASIADKVERWKIDQAAEFLQGFLSDQQIDSREVYVAAEKERFSDRTLRRAMDRIGVLVERTGTGREHRSLWSLPAGGQECCPAGIPHPGHSGQLSHPHTTDPPPGGGGGSVGESGGQSVPTTETAGGTRPAKGRTRRRKGQGGAS